uniref:Uncharacterized protein n=1 Tax=viral metagenome TaxID=1070528 RepID=A0A6M3XWS1_9ZZZZ
MTTGDKEGKVIYLFLTTNKTVQDIATFTSTTMENVLHCIKNMKFNAPRDPASRINGSPSEQLYSYKELMDMGLVK